MATKKGKNVKKGKPLAQSPAPKPTRLYRAVKYAGLPILIYFVAFCFFTWPWITHFNTRFFTDSGDGLQNVWNMWWINKSVTQLHTSPWFTTYLQAPFGVTLVGQTLNPINGFVGIILQHFMSLVQAFNTMIVFSFVFAGLTAFWLSHYFTKRYLPSLIGGFIFTFSSYHFAHAIGHMQLVSIEFIPLFILCWWKFVKKPSYLLAAGASVSLFLVLFCDYYYFLYCLLAAAGIVVYLWVKKEIPSLKDRSTYLPLALFAGLSLIIIAPLPVALLRANSRDMLTGSHPARLLSTDALTPFIDGGFWRFHSLTNAYWKHIHAFVAESSIYLGLSVICVLIYALIKRKFLHRDIGFWLILIITFGIFSLGPRLMVFGYSINHAPLPYVILEKVVPGLKLSGVPIRMMVMVTLGSAIVAAMVLSKINLSKRGGQVLLAVFSIILVVEMFPSTLPLTSPTEPAYTSALRALPSTGAVLDDAATTQSYQLYHQIAFDKPMVLGYISRTPESIVNKDAALVQTISSGDYKLLCSAYKLRYITTPANTPLHTTFPIVYHDGQAIIYDLKNSPKC